MAVVQISRIQVRRGQKNAGSGLPQLASGEFGWAIDTRELYIGNGAVSEGAPTVGNTKILTQFDDLFDLAESYQYRKDDTFIQTGTSTVSPIRRTLQQRLDDSVTGANFGLTGDSSQDATTALQRAIDQLYINTANKGSVQSRKVLHLDAGIYSITNTIFIPPNTTIQGAGHDKTIIRSNSANAIFKTVNESSTPGSPSPQSATTFNTQPRNISVKDLSLETTVADGIGLHLESCRDSTFENISIKGPWALGDTIPSDYEYDVGILIDSLSGSVKSENNHFHNLKITNWGYGVMSNFDIEHNHFSDCDLDTLGIGFAFGVDMILGSVSSGKATGPLNNRIEHSKFSNIEREGIWIEKGIKNTSRANYFELVGNNGGTEAQPEYSVIKFSANDNTSLDDMFTRTQQLSYTTANINNIPYLQEVQGAAITSQGLTHTVEISSGGPTKVFRLPGIKNQTFELDYHLVSRSVEMVRSGVLTVTIDAFGTPTVHLSDEYTYQGDTAYEDSVTFTAQIIDEDGDLTNDTIGVFSNASVDQLELRFRIKNKQTNIS